MQKKTFILLFSLIFLNLTAQEIELSPTKNVIVTFEKDIDSTKILVMLHQIPETKFLIYQLYPNGKPSDTKLPKFPSKSGVYYLSINYSMEFHSSEILKYKNNPENESLKFHFYKLKDKVFCEVISSEFRKLNKKIRLKKVDVKSIKKSLDEVRKRPSHNSV